MDSSTPMTVTSGLVEAYVPILVTTFTVYGASLAMSNSTVYDISNLPRESSRRPSRYTRKRLYFLLEVPLDVMKESDIGASELVECRRGEVEVVLGAPFAAVDDRD